MCITCKAIYTFWVPLLQISINSFVSYSNISRSMEKCWMRRSIIEQGTSLKKSNLYFGEGPPFVWWIHFVRSCDETNWFNPLWCRTCSSSSLASNLITASYGIRQGEHCRLQNRLRNWLYCLFLWSLYRFTVFQVALSKYCPYLYGRQCGSSLKFSGSSIIM